MNNSIAKTISVIVIASLLAGCGERPRDRALSGGAIGAGAGAVGGALIGGDPVTGAVIGAGVGAVTGAVTNKHQIDLDRH